MINNDFDPGEVELNPQDIDCGPDDENLESCPECGNVECNGDCFPSEPDDSMDGDAQTALASAGMGTDEDYEHNLIDDVDWEVGCDFD